MGRDFRGQARFSWASNLTLTEKKSESGSKIKNKQDPDPKKIIFDPKFWLYKYGPYGI